MLLFTFLLYLLITSFNGERAKSDMLCISHYKKCAKKALLPENCLPSL